MSDRDYDAGGWRRRHVLVVDDAAAQLAAVSWGFWSDRRGLLDDAVSRSYFPLKK
jgi:hypothetical protein